MAVTVTLMIHSGRENPRWMLAPDQAQELTRRLSGLQHRSPPALGGLGYSGFMIETENGVIYVFAHRELERWLLGTAKDAIDDRVRAWVEEQIGA